MKIEKKQEKNKVILTINVEQFELQHAFDHSLEHLAKHLKISGFRPGKAPRAIAIKHVNEPALKEETVSHALEETYAQAIEKEQIAVIDYPQVQIKKFTLDYSNPAEVTGELEYEASVDTVPETKVGDFRKIKINVPAVEKVTDADVDDLVKQLLKQRAEFKSLGEAAKTGHRVEVTFTGSVDGKPMPELTSKNHPLILGETETIPGFADNITGMKVGDNKKFVVVYPKDSTNKQFAGKKVSFDVEMLAVQEIILPELTDQIAADFGQKDVAKLKTAIREDLERQRKDKVHHEEEEQVVDAIIKLTTAEVPESLIQRELDRMEKEMKARINAYGMNYDDYLAQMKQKPEELRLTLRDEAEKSVKLGLALAKIMKELDIPAKDESSASEALHQVIELAKKNSK